MKVKLVFFLVSFEFIIIKGLTLDKDSLIAALEEDWKQIRQDYENVARQFGNCKDAYQEVNDENDLHYRIDYATVHSELDPFGMSVLAVTEMNLNILILLQLNNADRLFCNATGQNLKSENNNVEQLEKLVAKDIEQQLKTTHDQAKETLNAQLNKSAQLIAKNNEKLIEAINRLNGTLQYHLRAGHKKPIPTTCQQALSRTHTSGVYEIKVESNDATITVYCENDYEGGGWLVIQRRHDSAINFEKTWSEYEHGFGQPNGDFWLGLARLHKMTAIQRHELYILLRYEGKDTLHLKYDNFKIADENEKYKLSSLGTFSGSGENILSSSQNMEFTTYDNDNDLSFLNCASHRSSGWWYNGGSSNNYHNGYGQYNHNHDSRGYYNHNHDSSGYYNHNHNHHHSHFHYHDPNYSGFHGSYHQDHSFGCCGLSLNEHLTGTSSDSSNGAHCHGMRIEFAQMMIRPIA